MKSLLSTLRLVHSACPRSFWLRVIYVVIQSVLPLAGLFVLKLLVDAVTDGRDFPLSMLAVFCVLFLVGRIVSALNAINNDYLSQRLTDHLADLLQRQSATLDMQYYDNPAYHDTLHRAQQEASVRPLQVLNNIMALGGSLLSIAGVVALLVAASWWVVVVMVVAVVPAFVVRLYKARRIYRFRRDNTQLYRRTTYYGSLLTSRGAAMELRTYRLASLFRARFVASRRRLVATLLRISRRLGMLDVLCAVVEAVAMFSVVALLIRGALVGALTVGSFIMLFEAFRRGQGYLTSLVGAISGLYDNRLFMGNLYEFLALRPTIMAPADPLALPDTVNVIEFRDVTFRYPGMDRDVLTHYNLTARRGEVTRIDGCNGYGKSTLLKLLLRFYDPDQGVVLLDGVDIRRFAPDALRSRFGVLFQDFMRYALTVRENVNLGRGGDAADLDSTIEGCDQGLLDFVGRMPEGDRSLLTRLFDGGNELSMGQWQRVALARALVSDAPVLLLDEPTAWLDAESRRQVADIIEGLKKDKIILLVTHSQ